MFYSYSSISDVIAIYAAVIAVFGYMVLISGIYHQDPTGILAHNSQIEITFIFSTIQAASDYTGCSPSDVYFSICTDSIILGVWAFSNCGVVLVLF